MRELYPRYACRTGRDTPLMRESVPRICVEIGSFPHGTRRDTRSVHHHRCVQPLRDPLPDGVPDGSGLSSSDSEAGHAGVRHAGSGSENGALADFGAVVVGFGERMDFNQRSFGVWLSP